MADPIRIPAPDGTVVEFPANTSDDVIKKVMAENFPAKPAAAPASPAAPDGGGIVKTADDLVRAAANGMTFGLADRLAAWASSKTGIGAQPRGLKDLVTGAGNDYDSNLAREWKRTDDFAEAHPVVSMGTNMVGGAAVPLGVLGAAAKGASLGAKTLIGLVTGGTIGGAGGAISSRDWTDPWQVGKDAAIGGGTGLVIGAAMPGASQVIGKGVQTVADAMRARIAGVSRNTSNHLVGAMEADTPAAVRAELDRLGPDAMLADAGQALLGKTQGGALNSDEGRSVIFNAMKARDKATNARIRDDVEKALGPAEDPQTVTDHIIATRKRIDNNNYGLAMRGDPRVSTGPVLAELDDAITRAPAGSMERRALERTREMMMTEEQRPRIDPYTGRQALDGQGNMAFDRVAVNQDRAEVLHKVKQELDNVIEHEQPGLGVPAGALKNADNALKHFRFLLNDALEKQVPGYAHANDVSARLAKRAEAVKVGTQYLGEGKTTPSPDRFLTDFEARELGERIALAKGSTGEIARLLGTKENDLLALRRALQGEGGWNTEKLAIVHGQDAADELVGSVERNIKFRDTHNKVAENSQTEIRRAAREQMKPNGDTTELPIVGPSSNIPGMLLTLAKRYVAQPAWDALTHVDPTRSYGELGRIVTAQGAERDRYFQAIVDAMRARQGNAAFGAKAGDRSALGTAIVVNSLLDDQRRKLSQ